MRGSARGRKKPAVAKKPAAAKIARPGKGAKAGKAEKPATGLFNREFSWLDFNSRVLAQAAMEHVPLLERVKFLSICSTNLDEFFMVRVAGLKEQVRVATGAHRSAGLSAEDQLAGISVRVRDLLKRQSAVWRDELTPRLAQRGIELLRAAELGPADVRRLKNYFLRQVFPVLTPMSVDPAHPFPHLHNRGLFLCVRLKPRVEAEKPMFAFVEVPQILPRFVPMTKHRTNTRFVLLCEVIALFLKELFPGSTVIDSYTIRVTRDSDLEIDEEDAEDLLTVIQAELHERQWGNAVRLEIDQAAPEDVHAYLREMLDIERRDIYPVEGPMNFADFMFLWKLPGMDELRYPPWTPVVPPEWKGVDPFSVIAQRDRLLHHPYESFAVVSDFLEFCANDPAVLAIKMTLYRTGADSPLMRSLIKAANNGKQVVVLVELRARFDEATNIQWAQRLEKEGVHVVYGIVGLKTHCKACLVVRREDKLLRRYCHLSTGNYNHVTAGIYTDIGLFTANPEVGEDVANLFNMLTGFGHQEKWNAIVPSPQFMDEKLLRLIRTETQHARRGKEARIICKMNSLVHPPLIEALYDASRAGVKIQLIVRGICCLRPGVPGQSENIRVVSIVGRFLEHSRIFLFGNGDKTVVYLSSADWMQRNFFSRIETMFPLLDGAMRDFVVENVLGTLLADVANSWELKADGTWKALAGEGGSGFDCQAEFMKRKREAAAG